MSSWLRGWLTEVSFLEQIPLAMVEYKFFNQEWIVLDESYMDIFNSVFSIPSAFEVYDIKINDVIFTEWSDEYVEAYKKELIWANLKYGGVQI